MVFKMEKVVTTNQANDKSTTDLKVVINDFGPIFKGNIELKPLTIFIGPNNSGKSYAAMLLHSIFETYNLTFIHYFSYITNPKQFDRYIQFHDDAKSRIKLLFLKKFNIEPLVKKLIEQKEIIVPDEMIDYIVYLFYQKFYAENLEQNIIRSFASPLNKLIRTNQDSFNININYSSVPHNFCFTRNKLTFEKKSKTDLKIGVSIEETRYKNGTSKIFPMSLIITAKQYISEHVIPVSQIESENKEEYIKDFVIQTIIDAVFNIIASNDPIQVFYLPAARSGILQAYKALVISMLQKVPLVGIQEIDIPPLSGVVSDFISSIISSSKQKGPIFDLAEQFEKELLHGTIEVIFQNKYSYPEIQYTFQGTSIQLHRASSTVSEVAPISLYLKHLVKPGDVLIIEEPEAHLHPNNQRILAKYLVRLIRQGVKVLITTHSEILLEQLSSFILMSQLEPKARKEYSYLEDDYLKKEEVATFVFKYNEENKGYEINQIEIEDDGISQEEFTKIHELLYEEIFKLKKELE